MAVKSTSVKRLRGIRPAAVYGPPFQAGPGSEGTFMKRKWLAVLCILAVAALLTGCGGQQETNQTFTEVTQYLGPTPTASPTPTQDTSGGSVFSSNPYMVDTDTDTIAQQAMSEESYQDNGDYDTAAEATTVYPYAGSTPIPLEPVDAPTATPRAALSFTYITYTATSLGVTFDGPAGWVVDESVNGVYTLTEPEQQIKDNQLGIINVYASTVTSTYSTSELEKEIEQRLDDISATNFTEWKPSYTATRYLMGHKGVYANYSGTLADGTEVGGRVHAVSIDNVLYCIEITYPLNFKDDYLEVFSKMRESISRITSST
jgi:hypothetical protein